MNMLSFIDVWLVLCSNSSSLLGLLPSPPAIQTLVNTVFYTLRPSRPLMTFQQKSTSLAGSLACCGSFSTPKHARTIFSYVPPHLPRSSLVHVLTSRCFHLSSSFAYWGFQKISQPPPQADLE